jgi:hypothetical protein
MVICFCRYFGCGSGNSNCDGIKEIQSVNNAINKKINAAIKAAFFFDKNCF